MGRSSSPGSTGPTQAGQPDGQGQPIDQVQGRRHQARGGVVKGCGEPDPARVVVVEEQGRLEASVQVRLTALRRP